MLRSSMEHQRIQLNVQEQRREVGGPTAWTRPWRGLWSYWTKHPAATVVLGLVLWWCVATLPNVNSADPPGAPTAVTSSGKSYIPLPWAWLVRARDGSIVAIEPGKETASDKVIGSARFDYRLRPEFEGRYVSLQGSFQPGEEPAARKAFTDWLAASKEPYWARMGARLSGGNDIDTLGFQVRRTVQGLGALVILPFLIRSLAWAVPLVEWATRPLTNASLDPEERERRRRRKALLNGQCPGCGYAIAGLPRRRCPECNETWSAGELAG